MKCINRYTEITKHYTGICSVLLFFLERALRQNEPDKRQEEKDLAS